MLVHGLLGVLLCATLAPGFAAAQEPYSPLVPRGKLRLEILGEYSSFSSRYRTWTGGSSVREGLEDLSDPFSGQAGARVFPLLGPVEEAVREALGDDYSISLGTMASFMEKNTARVPVSLDVGIFDWLTAGVTVPAVQPETEFTFHFLADSTGANAGFGPGDGAASGFLSGLGRSIDAFGAFRDMVCTADPSSPECLDATAVLDDALSFQGGLSAMYGTLFAPLGQSAAGMALQARLAALAMAFEAAGVTGVPGSVPLANAFLSPEDIMEMVTDPAYGIGAAHPLGHWRPLWGLGDIEVRTDAQLLESGTPDGPRHVIAGAGARVRLPTGTQDDPANFVDAATGDAQIDVEVRGWMNGRWTDSFGLWADFRYGIQLPGTTERRVFSPDFTFAPASSQLQLDWDPGDYQFVELAPWFRFVRSMTVVAGYRYYRKGRDSFTRPATAETGSVQAAGAQDPEILVPHSGASSSRITFGLVYNRDVPAGDGTRGGPLEIRLLYRGVVGG
ncbi:MAG: hypothetical protein F4X60_07045, partial [Gemmatimonadetes bacterium]|nr:hypothetical protein [Gemmatimonadota bacterium]